MTVERKAQHRDYKTIESETIVLFSSVYAVVSLCLVSILFRFWFPTITLDEQVTATLVYVVISIGFLAFIFRESTRRTKINKLPSADITELCYFVKSYSQEESKHWHTTQLTFNTEAMKLLFGIEISNIAPAHDYFSYMLSERYIEIPLEHNVVHNRSNQNLSIRLTKKADTHLGIYEQAKHW